MLSYTAVNYISSPVYWPQDKKISLMLSFFIADICKISHAAFSSESLLLIAWWRQISCSLSGSPGVLRYFAGARASENMIFVFSSAERLSRFCNTQAGNSRGSCRGRFSWSTGGVLKHLNTINPFVKLVPQWHLECLTFGGLAERLDKFLLFYFIFSGFSFKFTLVFGLQVNAVFTSAEAFISASFAASPTVFLSELL